VTLVEGNEGLLLTFTEAGVEGGEGGEEGGRAVGEEQQWWLRYAYRNNACPGHGVR
jgi:hypothetical protein